MELASGIWTGGGFPFSPTYPQPMKTAILRYFCLLGIAALVGCVEYVPPPNAGMTNPPPGGAGGTGVGGQTMASSALSQQEISSLLAVHNQARAEVGVAPVSYSSSLAAYAQAWADHLASSGCQMKHRPSSGPWAQIYGENIAMISGASANAGQASRMWYDEKSAYHGQPVTMSNLMSIGHYTQMVWRGTTHVGCGKAVCANGYVIFVCNYNPSGNTLNGTPY